MSTALFLNLVVALTATAVCYRNGLVELRLASAFVPGIIAGSLFGGVLSTSLNPQLIIWLLVACVVRAGDRMLHSYWEAETEDGTTQTSFSRRPVPVIIAFSFAIGILSGLVGIGGGVLIFPFLIFGCKYPVKRSAGATAFVMVFGPMFGLIGHYAVGRLDLNLIAVTAIAAFGGAILGTRLMTQMRVTSVRLILGAVMLFIASQLVLRLIGVI